MSTTGFTLLTLLAILVGAYLHERSKRRTSQVDEGLNANIMLPYEEEWELYHNDFSLCSKKVRVCLAELEFKYRAHHVELIETGGYETLSPAFLKVNPAATVPVLLHHGRPVYESHAIIAYLSQHAPEGVNSLRPEMDAELALMHAWVKKASIVGDDPETELSESAASCVAILTAPLFAASIEAIPYYKISEGILFHRLPSRALKFFALKLVGLKRLAAIPLVVGMVDRAKEHLSQHLHDLESLLADDRPYITGEAFTLADVSWMVLFDRLLEADWFDTLLGENQFPAVLAYWQRLRARPSYEDAVLQHSHPAITEASKKIREQRASNSAFYGRQLPPASSGGR